MTARAWSTLFLFFLVSGFQLQSLAQNTEGKTDDAGRIVLNAYVPDQAEGLPEIAKSMIENKLTQIATQSGLGGSSAYPQFIITAHITVLTKDITPTAPAMTALTLDVTFYIGNGFDGTKFESASVTAKGVGTNETKAYIDALKNISPANSNVQRLVTNGKKKIMEYYNSKCEAIIKSARSMASQNKYEEAIYTLTSVPDVCRDCYEKCLTAVGPIYKQYIDRQCKVALGDARSHWLASQDAAGAAFAANILATIEPDASCYADATKLATDIGKRVRELDNREWDFKMKVHNDQVSIDRERIQAYRAVGVAFGNGQPKQITYNIRGWW